MVDVHNAPEPERADEVEVLDFDAIRFVVWLDNDGIGHVRTGATYQGKRRELIADLRAMADYWELRLDMEGL